MCALSPTRKVVVYTAAVLVYTHAALQPCTVAVGMKWVCLQHTVVSIFFMKKYIIMMKQTNTGIYACIHQPAKQPCTWQQFGVCARKLRKSCKPRLKWVCLQDSGVSGFYEKDIIMMNINTGIYACIHRPGKQPITSTLWRTHMQDASVQRTRMQSPEKMFKLNILLCLSIQ